MKKQHVPLALLIAVLVVCFSASLTLAQDMAKVAPEKVKVVLDNDKVRVFDVQIKAGEKLPMHSHPSNIVVPMNSAKVKTTLSDGKVMETEFKEGVPRWSDAVTHANEALSDLHVLVIELKDKKMMKK